jgi:hypothetical protein
MDDQRAKRKKKNLKILGIFAAIILIIIIAGASGSSKKNTTSNAAQTSPASKPAASTATKAAVYQATLLNGANTDPTPMMLPGAGFDHNDGWDTAAQASIDSSSATAIQPAVTVKDAKTLELDINVKNTGTAAGMSSYPFPEHRP